MKSESAKQKTNKKNAAKSTGPKTEEGKQTVSLNGIAHGLRSLKPVIPWLENEEDWITHRNLITTELQPTNSLEIALADRIALGFWRLARSVESQPRVLQAAREKHRNRAISNFILSKGIGGFRESTETTFDNLLSQVDHLDTVAATWQGVLEDSKDPIPTTRVADDIFDSVCPVEKWAELGESFNEVFDWPPETTSDLHIMIDWLIENLEEETVLSIEQYTEAAQCRAKDMSRLVERIEIKAEQAAVLGLVESDVMEKLQRYETSIHRTLLKDLHELQRLQGLRNGNGDAVAVPVAIDVTVDT